MSAYNYETLAEHAGHEIECVIYAGVNAAVECMDCNTVLIDFDKRASIDFNEGLPDEAAVSKQTCPSCVNRLDAIDKDCETCDGTGTIPMHVEMVAGSYKWICDHCEELNSEIETKSRVACAACGTVFNVSNYEHAIGK